MRVFVNLPETPEDIAEFKNRVAGFHATLMIEKIRQLPYDDNSKKKLLNIVLDHLKEKAKQEEQDKDV